MDFKDNEFITQYAIRMPDGNLYGCREIDPSEAGMMMFGGMGIPMGAFGFGFGEEDDPEPFTTPPTVWYERKEAERCLQSIQEQAKVMGIEYWGGQIVERLCSPFTADASASGFVDKISNWLREQ